MWPVNDSQIAVALATRGQDLNARRAQSIRYRDRKVRRTFKLLREVPNEQAGSSVGRSASLVG